MHHFSTVLRHFLHFAVGLMDEEKENYHFILTIPHSASLDLSFCEQEDTTDRKLLSQLS